MALSVGNIVLLAIGAILLVTGAARTAVYLVPPGLFAKCRLPMESWPGSINRGPGIR